MQSDGIQNIGEITIERIIEWICNRTQLSTEWQEKIKQTRAWRTIEHRVTLNAQGIISPKPESSPAIYQHVQQGLDELRKILHDDTSTKIDLQSAVQRLWRSGYVWLDVDHEF